MAIEHLPPPSALDTLFASHAPSNVHASYYQSLALQVLHNLQHQHDWTSLHIHTYSSIKKTPLPRPLISGLPPHRIYVHPDDQVQELQRGVKDGEGKIEREWVLPTHLAEKWSLRRFADVFDALEEVPSEKLHEDDGEAVAEGKDSAAESENEGCCSRRRGGKRLLLATSADDSTIVYYIVHDGIVKPRQN